VSFGSVAIPGYAVPGEAGPGVAFSEVVEGTALWPAVPGWARSGWATPGVGSGSPVIFTVVTPLSAGLAQAFPQVQVVQGVGDVVAVGSTISPGSPVFEVTLRPAVAIATVFAAQAYSEVQVVPAALAVGVNPVVEPSVGLSVVVGASLGVLVTSPASVSPMGLSVAPGVSVGSAVASVPGPTTAPLVVASVGAGAVGLGSSISTGSVLPVHLQALGAQATGLVSGHPILSLDVTVPMVEATAIGASTLATDVPVFNAVGTVLVGAVAMVPASQPSSSLSITAGVGMVVVTSAVVPYAGTSEVAAPGEAWEAMGASTVASGVVLGGIGGQAVIGSPVPVAGVSQEALNAWATGLVGMPPRATSLFAFSATATGLVYVGFGGGGGATAVAAIAWVAPKALEAEAFILAVPAPPEPIADTLARWEFSDVPLPAGPPL